MDDFNNDTYYSDRKQSQFETVWGDIEKYVFVPLGVIGNILIFIILSQPKNQQHASSIIFSSLAVSDIIILLSGLYNFMLIPSIRTSMECKISSFFGYASVQLSSVLLATVAVERVCCVKWPHKAKTIFSAGNARVIVIILAVVLSTFNISTIISHDAYTEDGFSKCEPDVNIAYFMSVIYPWIDFGVVFAVPFLIITTSSILIIIQLRHMRERVGTGNNDMVHSVTMTLLAASVTFLVTLSPFSIYQIVYPIPPSEEPGYSIWVGLLTISQANAGANFFIYFLSGRRFRADVKVFFMTCCCQPLQRLHSMCTQAQET